MDKSKRERSVEDLSKKQEWTNNNIVTSLQVGFLTFPIPLSYFVIFHPTTQQLASEYNPVVLVQLLVFSRTPCLMSASMSSRL